MILLSRRVCALKYVLCERLVENPTTGRVKGQSLKRTCNKRKYIELNDILRFVEIRTIIIIIIRSTTPGVGVLFFFFFIANV